MKCGVRDSGGGRTSLVGEKMLCNEGKELRIGNILTTGASKRKYIFLALASILAKNNVILK